MILHLKVQQEDILNDVLWFRFHCYFYFVGTCDDSLLRLIVEDEKKIDQIKKCLWRFGRKHVDSNM